MLSVEIKLTMMQIVMLSVEIKLTMMQIVMLSVVMLNVIMLSIVAPVGLCWAGTMLNSIFYCYVECS